MSGKPTKAVLEMSKLRIVGNVTPNIWYELIRFPITPKYPRGKPDPLAVLILSEICYWYRVSDDVRDVKTTKSLPPQKRFLSDKWQTSYQQLADKFGFSKVQVKDALYRLADSNLITMEFRTVRLPTTILNNVLYVEPIVKNIEKITFYDFDIVKNQYDKSPPPPDNHPLPPKNGERLPPKNGERLPPKNGERLPPKNGETNTVSSTMIPTDTDTDIKEVVTNLNSDLAHDKAEQELLAARLAAHAVESQDVRSKEDFDKAMKKLGFKTRSTAQKQGQGEAQAQN